MPAIAATQVLVQTPRAALRPFVRRFLVVEPDRRAPRLAPARNGARRGLQFSGRLPPGRRRPGSAAAINRALGHGRALTPTAGTTLWSSSPLPPPAPRRCCASRSRTSPTPRRISTPCSAAGPGWTASTSSWPRPRATRSASGSVEDLLLAQDRRCPAGSARRRRGGVDRADAGGDARRGARPADRPEPERARAPLPPARGRLAAEVRLPRPAAESSSGSAKRAPT